MHGPARPPAPESRGGHDYGIEVAHVIADSGIKPHRIDPTSRASERRGGAAGAGQFGHDSEPELRLLDARSGERRSDGGEHRAPREADDDEDEFGARPTTVSAPSGVRPHPTASLLRRRAMSDQRLCCCLSRTATLACLLVTPRDYRRMRSCRVDESRVGAQARRGHEDAEHAVKMPPTAADAGRVIGCQRRPPAGHPAVDRSPTRSSANSRNEPMSGYARPAGRAAAARRGPRRRRVGPPRARAATRTR